MSNVVDNERKGMHQSQDQECVQEPAVTDLELFVRDASQKRYPVGFACCGTIVTLVGSGDEWECKDRQDERHTCE